MGKLHKIRRAFWKTVERTGQPPERRQAVLLLHHYWRGGRIYVKSYPFGSYHFRRDPYRGFTRKLEREYEYRKARGLLGDVANRGHSSGRDQAAPAATQFATHLRAEWRVEEVAGVGNPAQRGCNSPVPQQPTSRLDAER